MARKGQSFQKYTEELKREAVRLRLEERKSLREIREQLGVKSDAQIIEWVKRAQQGESFDDQRGVWNRKNFNSLEEENAYLKAQVEYFKKAQSKSTREGMVLKKERFSLIDSLRQAYPLRWLLQIAEVSKAGYYKWRKYHNVQRLRQKRDMWHKEHILSIHRQHPYYGYKRMTRALAREGMVMNHKRVRRLMRELGIQSIIRKKRPFYERKTSVVFKNHLNREFQAEKQNQKFVTDITYVRIGEQFAYLSAVLDLYNNEIVAWKLSSRNDLDLVLTTLRQLEGKSLTTKPLFHSDQGFQYTSKSYAKQLEKLGFVGSHSRRGNCFDNACIESFFSHLKTEKLYLVCPKTYEMAYRAIQEYIQFYNTERFQEKLHGLSPIEYREKAVA
ncbi:IS3-like element ISBth8 family transposase [Bacillus cereus]|uniref:IS3-like element ISBth8 family transposase n=1 Tax=Bacillus thuringiensis TaxID=1428 RepID=UPI000B444728|nr:IS3-like element ISBth8 family transposase [Bacillus thuringiensis]MDA1925985.1 IS3-like element ISBth8 family transposase [Bacillus cereus]MDA2186105.1 IS3-like element ISBth8 family transposase [Bacillus cereus]